MMLKKFYKKYGYFILIAYLIAAFFYPPLGVIAVICMVAPIIFAFAGMGRYWCGNFCPRGNFYQNAAAKISSDRPIPAFLKSWWFRTFIVLFIIGNFSRGVYKNWGSLAGIGMVFYRIIVITTLVGILLALFFKPRTWCSFCPMGTLAALTAKLRGRKISIQVANTCVSCGLCSKKCPMELSPKDAAGGNVASNDCIFCQECVYACPKDAVSLHSSADV